VWIRPKRAGHDRINADQNKMYTQILSKILRNTSQK